MGDWCLIESDPGVFTELVEKVGVKGVKFDEVIDMDLIPRESHGLIFLFKCKTQEARQVVSNPPNGLFFAKQVRTKLLPAPLLQLQLLPHCYFSLLVPFT